MWGAGFPVRDTGVKRLFGMTDTKGNKGSRISSRGLWQAFQKGRGDAWVSIREGCWTIWEVEHCLTLYRMGRKLTGEIFPINSPERYWRDGYVSYLREWSRDYYSFQSGEKDYIPDL